MHCSVWILSMSPCHLILASCGIVAACCPSPCPALAAPDSSIAGEFLHHDTPPGGGAGCGGVVSCSAAEQLILTCKVRRGEQRHGRFSVIFHQVLCSGNLKQGHVSLLVAVFAKFYPSFHRSFSQICMLKQNGRWAWPRGHLGCS